MGGATAREIATLKRQDRVYSVSLSHAGDRVAVGGRDKMAVVYALSNDTDYHAPAAGAGAAGAGASSGGAAAAAGAMIAPAAPAADGAAAAGGMGVELVRAADRRRSPPIAACARRLRFEVVRTI